MDADGFPKRISRAKPVMDDFKESLPRFSDLHSRFVRRDCRNFFWDFPARLESHESVTFAHYQIIERWLQFIPDSQWPTFTKKVGETAELCDEIGKRHWEKLHDKLHEAVGAKVLSVTYGCGEIWLLDEDNKTLMPDWRGRSANAIHYLEVKTINHSDDERQSWYRDQGEPLVHTTVLPKALREKIRGVYERAQNQLLSPVDAAGSMKAVAFVLRPDHNVDPIDESLESLFLNYFDEIEMPEFPTHLVVFGA